MRTLLVTLSLLFLFSCSSHKENWEADKPLKLSADEILKLKQDADALWPKRDDKASLEKCLAALDRINQSITDYKILVMLTRGHYLLADGHTYKKEDKIKIFEKAVKFGEEAMGTNHDFKKEVKSGVEVSVALNKLSSKEIESIYWTAASLGKWAKATSIAAALKYKGQIKLMIEKVNEFDSNFFYGAVPRYWGAFYSVAPSFAGGDMDKSLAEFNRSISVAPDYLGTKVLLAELYYVKKGDKKGYEKELNEVLAAKADNIMDLKPENMIEKNKAKKLLAKTNENF